MPAQAVTAAALGRDTEAQKRQFIVVDRDGGTAGWTGGGCEAFAGHRTGQGVAVAGTILAGAEVLTAMLDGHDQQAAGTIVCWRPLLPGQRQGGDARGTDSAAIKIYGRESFAAIDLRIDWSPAPLEAMSALLDQTTGGSYAGFFQEYPPAPLKRRLFWPDIAKRWRPAAGLPANTRRAPSSQ
ncbi:MAG: DUF1028 domain-containing protein [Devosia sp.]